MTNREDERLCQEKKKSRMDDFLFLWKGGKDPQHIYKGRKKGERKSQWTEKIHLIITDSLSGDPFQLLC